jgi:tetratricopeptide (TPR) repeat protein
MKNFDEHIDLIERYLYDDLTQEELEEFNGLLQKDSEFNKLFYEMDNLLEGIRRSAKQTTVEEKLARLEEALPLNSNLEIEGKSTNVFRKIINSINFYTDQFITKLFNLDHEEVTVVPVNSRGQNLDHEEVTVVPVNSRGQASTFTILGRIKLIAASSIIMIFLVTTILYTQLSAVSHIELYSNNFEPLILDSSVVRSGGDNEKSMNLTPDEILIMANHEFNNSNFGKAIGLIEKIPDSDKLLGMKYCGALSYMKIENFDRAKDLWNQLEQENDIVWQERSKWFLALCYLYENDTESVVKYLKNVSEIGGENQERAIQLLKKVN